MAKLKEYIYFYKAEWSSDGKNGTASGVIRTVSKVNCVDGYNAIVEDIKEALVMNCKILKGDNVGISAFNFVHGTGDDSDCTHEEIDSLKKQIERLMENASVCQEFGLRSVHEAEIVNRALKREIDELKFAAGNNKYTDNESPYGELCPVCGCPAIGAEKRTNGDLVCDKGHMWQGANKKEEDEI